MPKTIQKPIAAILGNAFGRYAKYIIQDRALPDIRDGLKPVQRRILYAMYNLGLTSDKPYKKSARTVGEVIGKYHPHGDSSIYEAMVRMSQNWKNNLPLLQMHGNNGSIDGDSAAAMRYTECRLAPVADLMLANLKKNTVSMMFNFDDTEKEPTVLPALLPNLLINGAVGIAAGYATNIPTHNSTEIFNALIHRIDHPEADLETMMRIIPGPDFPTGGVIQGIDGIREAFATGRGKFIISSKIEYRQSSKFNQIIVSEIPYETNKSVVVKEILELNLPNIVEVRDESDQNGVQIVIDVRKDTDLEQLKNFLLKNTHLQINYSTNFVVITNRKPRLTPFLEALDDYLKHAQEIIVRASTFDLEKAQARFEIINGLIKASENIDQIIRLIRQSQGKEEAKQQLIQYFAFTTNQAEAIVTLRLYRLTKTDRTALEAERAELAETIEQLQMLLNSEKLQKTYLKNLFREFRKEYGQERKTLILRDIENITFDATEMIERKNIGVVVTRNGYIKVFPQRSDGDFNQWGIKPNDAVISFTYTDTKQNLLLITKYGKAINLPFYKLKLGKWKDAGLHLNELVDLETGDQIVQSFIFDQPSGFLFLFTASGLGKKMLFDEAISKQKMVSIIKLRDQDYVTAALWSQEEQNVIVLNANGNVLHFATSEIPLSQKTAMGVIAMRLKESEILTGAVLSNNNDSWLFAVADQGIKLAKMNEFAQVRRGGVGKPIALNVKSRPVIFQQLYNVTPESSVFLMDDEQQVHPIKISDVPNNQRPTFLDWKIIRAFQTQN